MTNQNKVRMSIASFICPQDDVQIEPLDTMVNGTKNKRMYRKIRYGDFLRYSLQRNMDGKSHTNLIKLENE